MNLKNYNWFRIDSHCEHFYEVEAIDELKKVVEKYATTRYKIYIIGEGSNILLHRVLKNIVLIKLNFRTIQTKHESKELIIKLDAGVQIDDLVNLGIKYELQSLLQFSGIPGCMGGATFMNIHYNDTSLSDFVQYVTVMEKSTGKLRTIPKNKIHYAYKTNFFKQNPNVIIVNTTLKIKKTRPTTTNLKAIKREIIRKRNSRYPKSNTCGCFFYNLDQKKGKEKSAGYQIEKANLDLSSFKTLHLHPGHKNMIVTKQGCTSDDIFKLAQWIKDKVYEKTGHTLEPECRLIGFETSL
jgi:UDP-N-acetylmuramate dehydrogenase